MLKISKYLTEPVKCFIPKCRAICCANAPLPENFLPKHQDKIQRRIYGAFNMGQNDIHDTYNSVIYSTRPITFIGVDQNGHKLYGITKETMEELNLQSMEDVKNLIASWDAKKIYNYCPFITDYARCSVYKERPPICREFGTMPGKLNKCPDKASRLEIIKFITKSLLDVKGTFNGIKEMLKSKFFK